MSDISGFSAEDVKPDREAVLRMQGIPPEVELRGKHEMMITQALDMFMSLAAPTGMCEEVSRSKFKRVYRGEGRNERRNPLGRIYPKAEHLALFAVTLGEEISRKITSLFAAKDFALGYVLDATASLGADRCADKMQESFFAGLKASGRAMDAWRPLRYSPGYCGWHISGQAALFAALEPGKIGITLRESYLMEPLKSVSGVIVCGSKEIHEFKNNFPFCRQCTHKACRDRIASL